MSKLNTNHQAAIIFAVLAVFFGLLAFVPAVSLGLMTLALILAGIALTVGSLYRPHPQATASATVDDIDEAGLAPETNVHRVPPGSQGSLDELVRSRFRLYREPQATEGARRLADHLAIEIRGANPDDYVRSH